MNKKFLVCITIFILFVVGLSGCTENTGISSNNILDELLPLSISYFKVIPTEIKMGETANLSWIVKGALSVNIDNGIGNVSLTSEKCISPTQTTNYTLTAWNSTTVLSISAKIIVSDFNETKDGEEPVEESENEENETHEYKWHFIRRYSGTGRTTTDVFHIDSDIKWKIEWRIITEIPDYIWNESTSPPIPYFDFHVMKANTIYSVAYVKSGKWYDSGILYINRTSPQSYYLDITSRHIDSWMIDVYEWKIH